MPSFRLFQDRDLNVDLKAIVKYLNNRCKYHTFALGSALVELPDEQIVCPDSYKALSSELLSESRDDLHVLVFTGKPYANNFFFESNENVTIVSGWGWHYLTNLPVANGVVYLIADFLASDLDDSCRHDETTGCIYDFLWDKDGIDRGMREARLCSDCLSRISGMHLTKRQEQSLDDLRIVLDDLGAASRWEKNIVEYWTSSCAPGPATKPTTPTSIVHFLPESDPNDYIDKTRERIQSVCSRYMRVVDERVPATEKGETFEGFAGEFLQLIRGWRIIERNARLEDCEIDLIIDISDGPDVLRRQMGERIYVECKNREGKSDVRDMSHFILNVMNRKLKAGLFLSVSGITGYSPQKWRSIGAAYRRIVETSRIHDLTIIPLVGEDIEAVRNGANLAEHLRELLNRQAQV